MLGREGNVIDGKDGSEGSDNGSLVGTRDVHDKKAGQVA